MYRGVITESMVGLADIMCMCRKIFRDAEDKVLNIVEGGCAIRVG